MNSVLSSIVGSSLVIFFGVVEITGTERGGTPKTEVVVAHQVSDFVLPDSTGTQLSLADFGDAKLVVVVFMGTACPIANGYVPYLNELQERYRDQKVQVIGINSNLSDSPESIAKHVKEFKIGFPVLVDSDQLAADLFGARRTPESFVLDRRRRIRYRGRIDDRIGYTFKRENSRRSDLEEAVKELLAGKVVSVDETEIEGCVITRRSSLQAKGQITYAKQIAEILNDRCANCHHPGTAAPFSLLTYEDAQNWSGMIRETVLQRRMPPWNIDSRYGKFSNDLRMTPKEINTLVAWIDDGTPFGDKKDLPKPRHFTDGWMIGKPDIIFKMPREYEVKATGTVEYQYFVTPTNFKQDMWVQASEARPGNRAVVHHIIAFIREKNSRSRRLSGLGGFAPGEEPLVYPAGVGKRVPAGAEIVWQVHYTPTGKVERDRSELGLIFCKEPPQRVAKGGGAFNRRFTIPPGAGNYLAVSTARFSKDVELLSLMPHMHLRGKDFRYTAHYPDGSTEILLNVPNYDFNWQHRYLFAKPFPIPKGTTIECVAHFDNSADNPANPDATQTVRWGDQTWEEMMIGWYSHVEVARDNPAIQEKKTAADKLDTERKKPQQELKTPEETKTKEKSAGTANSIATETGRVPLAGGTAVAQETGSRPHGPEAKAANLDVKTLHALDIALQEQVDKKHVSGVIGLIARHGNIGYYETFGQRVIEDKAPMTKDTLFRIYSMTKPIVAVTAMSLWEEGKFKLDDPISIHLPEWQMVTVREGDEVVPTQSPITPRHLMTHSSGLSYNKDGLELGRRATLQEFSQALAKQPLNFHPGTNYVYGYSIDILGRYIEAIEGKSLDVVMRERVLDRLGMDDTEFWVRDSSHRDRVAQVYRQRESGELRPGMLAGMVMTKPSRMMGGQGLVSTAGDYARFCQMLLNKGELDGKRVLKTDTVNLMFKNHLRKIHKVYGLGGIVDGKGGYSWGGAAGTKFWIDTRNDCYGVFMIQTWGYRAPTYRVFRRLVDQALLAEPAVDDSTVPVATQEKAKKQSPTHANVSYGPHASNVIDLWIAEGDGPRPLLVYIHGGGWTGGTKNRNLSQVQPFLDKGISYAAVEYRLTGVAPLPAPVHDAARAIQFIRSKAKEWNINSDRIALTGGSAGACTSMWILCHDDLADPNSADPVLRQSTRVTAAAVAGGQTSIDPKVIEGWLGPNVLKHSMINRAVGEATMAGALKNYDKHHDLYVEFSPYNHLTKDDPPLFMAYGNNMTLPSENAGHGIHHPVYGIKMKEKADRVASECHLVIKGVSKSEKYATATEFLLAKLLEP